MTAADGESVSSDFVEIEAPDGSIVEFPKDTAPDVMARAMRQTYGLSETGRRARADRDRGILAEREAQSRRAPMPSFDEMGQPTVPEPPAQVAVIPEPAPFVAQDERTTAGAMGRQVARGAIETAALAPKGAAALGARLDYNEQDIANLTDRYVAADQAQRAQMRREALAQFKDSPGTRDSLLARFSDIDEGVAVPRPQSVTPIEQRQAFKAGEAIDEYGRTRFPTTKAEDEAFWTGQVPRALGSTVAMAPVALAGAPFGALGRLMAGVGLATTGSGEAAQAAVDRRRQLEDMVRAGDAPSPDAYPSDRQIATAAGQGLAPGALDAAAIDNLLRPVVRVPGFRGLIAAVAKKAIEQGIVEGTTEGVQQVMQNLIAQHGYNPDQGVLEQVAENALVGGAVGVLTGGLAGGMIRPRRGDAQQAAVSAQQPVLQQEIPPDVSRETQGAGQAGEINALPPATDPAAADLRNQEIPQAGQPGQTPDMSAPVRPAPTPEDLQAVLDDPRPVAEIMAERERQAARTATIAAVEQEDGPDAAAAVAKVMDGAGQRRTPMQAETAADVDMAAAQAQQPTPAQAEAGNYRKGHVTVQGLDIAIEVPRGGERAGVGPDGRPWSVQMPAHYGYLKAGKDSGDGKVDVFVGDFPEARYAYVIDQIDPATGKFDEPKVMLGMNGEGTAAATYEMSYSDGSGPARMGAMTRMTVAELKAWLRDGNPKKPLAYVPGPAIAAPAAADAWASDPIVVNAAENARILAAVDESGVPLNWARPALPNNPPPFSEPRPASTVPLGGQTAAPSSAGFPSPGPMPTTVAPQDPVAQARAFAAQNKIRLSNAEMVDVRELVADGVDPEEAVEIALTRSGLAMADEIVAATEEVPYEAQAQAEPARDPGEVPAQEGQREEPADARAEAGRAPQGEQPRGVEQSAPAAEPVAEQPAPKDDIAAALDTALDEQFGAAKAPAAPAKRDVSRERAQREKKASADNAGSRPVRGQPGYYVDRAPRKRPDSEVARDLARPFPYVAQAFRKSPWHSELGYGATPEAAVADALSRLGITEAPRTAGQAATSAAKNTAAGLGEATTALVRLFGAKPNRLTSGIGFDEDTYREARPHFVAALRHFQAAAGDIAEAARALVRHLAANGLDRAGIEAMRPYLSRFLGEVRDGGVDLDPATIQAEASPKETPNERTDVRDEGTQALDEVASGEGQSPERLGSADGRDAGGGQDGRGADAGSDAAGVSKPRGRGGRAGGVRSAAAGTGRRRPRVGDTGTREDGEGAPQGDGGLTPETASPPNIPAINFQITPDLRLGKGGEVEKFNDNIAAIRIVKQLEAEKRRATPDEQAKLARYVGWGGLANAFPEPGSGEFKDKWKQRGEELRNLLTAKEYAAARRSTRNAHYTSETVVSFMWDAARRLGFRGGMALESSMGTGNFIGLKPSDIPAHFIGVEYDSTTARIAAHLYPQSTVLHAGFHQAPLPDNVFALNIGNPPFGNESLRFQHRPDLNGVTIHNQFFRAGILSVRPGGLQIMVVSRFLMDAQDNATRAALAREAKLIAAIRLPDTAFKENARTEVVTDVIILQRLTGEERKEAGEIIDALQAQPKKDRQEEAQRAALAGRAPEWIATETVKDPLGGDAITVNGYFASNPDQIVGVLERSGSMQHGADVTVRLDDPATLADRLAKLVKRLPENVSKIGDDVIAATEERFKLLSDSLRIAISNEEPGHLSTTPEGKILRVIEREGPDGGFLFEKMEITANSPWSDRLSMDPQGRWYSLDLVVDEKGEPVKQAGSDGKPTRRNLYQRTVYEKLGDVPQSMRLGDSGFARIKQIVRMRDLVRDQIVLETEDAPTKAMEANRRKLADAYEAFTRDHGPINRPVNLRLAMTMPDGGLVAALESKYTPERSAAQAAKSGQDPQSEKATPAPILKSRAIPKYEPPTSAATAADGLVISLAERGRVDLARIAELRGATEQEVIDELQAGDKPQIFLDPETQTWETANTYLTGPVKRKLLAAREKGIEINVTALEAVQPEPWPSENIAVQLGATWVPTDIYADFAKHIFGGTATVRFSRVTNGFDLQVANVDETKAEQYKAQGAVTNASGSWILSRVLNSQMPRVTYTDSDDVTRVDTEATDIAIQIGGTMRAEFQDWIFADSDRRQQLTDLFNEKFNNRVSRQHDGSHLILPGKVPDQVIAMRRHQKNAIWRGISERFLLIDHVVGAGKTFTAIARAMERRRMGLSRKAMVIVPNHLVEQWEADTYRLYPGAKVLAAGKKDFEAKNRRRLFGRIATGDWDLVIVPHSSFGFIGISPDTELRFLEGEMRDAMAAIDEAWEQAKEDGADQGFRKPFNVKEAERLAEKIQQRMDKVRAGTRDRLLTFEQLGVDDLTVDEAHEFKNLFYSSRMTGVRGMGDKTGSRKASDLYNKVRVLRESGGAVTFMTGTPISNSAVEMYSMMRYLAADKLDEQGLTHFDAWRAQYVEALPKLEPTESGALKSVTRLGRRWANMRSLMELYYEFTDAVSLDDIKKWYAEDNAGKPFPVPKVKIASNKERGDRQLIAIKPTKAQEELLREVLGGFNGLESIKDPKERNAERLRLMDRARKLSLDVRAVNPRHESKEKGGKLERVADEVKRIYDATTKDRGTQLVFLDRSVPRSKSDAKIIKDYDDLIAKQRDATTRGDEAAYQEIAEKLEKFDRNEIEELRAAQAGGWNAYDQIKQNLVARGIPANQIRFIQEANNDEQKAAMFDAVKGGKVRVLIGSTPRMGAGTNVQDRLVALHHVDVTWKPSDIEQREGRIIRQGNLFATPGTKENPNPLYRADFAAEIIAYATEKTVDAKMWDLNATKLNFINGIRKYDGTFEMEVDDADSVSMAEMAALASGDPLLLERVQAEIDISALEVQERGHRRKLYAISDQRNEAERWIAEGDEKIAKAKADQEWSSEQVAALEAAVSNRKVNVDGKDYTSEFAAMQAAKAAIAEQQGGDEKIRYSIQIDGKAHTSQAAIEDTIKDAIGVSDFEMTLDGKVIRRPSRAGVTIATRISEAYRDKQEAVSLGTMMGMEVEADLSSRIGEIANVYMNFKRGKRISSQEYVGQLSPKNKTLAWQKVSDRLESVASGVRHTAGSSTQWIVDRVEKAKRDLPRLREQADQPFPKAAELKAKRERLRELVGILTDKPKTTAETEEGGDDVRYQMAPADRASLRVAGEIDATVNLTPKDAAQRDAVANALKVTLRRMLGKAAPDASVFDSMMVGEQEVTGAYSPASNLIAVSLRSPDPIGTVRHETIHVLRQLGLIYDAAWSALTQAAETGGWLDKHSIDERWGEGLTREQALEEAIAEEFGVGLREGVWKTGNAKADAIFQRIAEFFRRVRAEVKRALSATGLRELSDADVAELVFSLIERGAFREGEISAREPQGAMAQGSGDDRTAFQMAAAGAQQAANTPQPRRMRTLRAAISALRGGDAVDPLAKVRVPNDIGWARKTTVTPRTIAAYFPAFADAFFAGTRQFQARDMSISELTEIARPYLDLEQASKDKVAKVIEHGRMAGEVYTPEDDGTIKVENKVGQQVRGKIGGVTLMADGEKVTLDAKEVGAYRAYRKVMDRALDKFRDQVVREWGFDPNAADAPKTAEDVDDLARNTENAGERARLKTLSTVLGSIETAKRRGYVPFTRYGSHYVTVTSMQDGKSVVVHREHIEPGLTSDPRAFGPLKRLTIPRLEQQAAALRARLAEIYPPRRGFQISELREVTPASFDDIPDFSDLDAIIAAANLPADQAAAVQQALGEVIQKRGFRAHFIKSRNIPGYSTDFERSLADYIVGISGYLARREHLPEIEAAIASIPATQPELRRYAKDWNDYIQNPSEEWNGLRQAGFLWYLSGRLSSALVNLSQVPMVTAPYLSMFASPVQASAEIARAYKDAGLAIRPKPKSMGGAGLDFFDPDALPADVREAVKKAIADGTLLPIETFQEMARAQGKTPKSRSIGAKAKTAQDAAAFMFQAAERTNRLVSFIAAYRLAQRPEVMGRIRADLRDNPLWTRRTKERRQDAATFAAFVVEETQFLLGKINRTKMMRGPGSVIFQFKAFAANYIELMARLGAFGSGVHRGGRNYAALAGMAFALFMVGGILGLPGAEDGLEMIEALIQSMTGVDPQLERGLRETAGSLAAWAARQLGAGEEAQDTVSRFTGRVVARGVARESGVDVSQRIGQGRFVPKPTGTEHDSYWYRTIGLAGIPGSWVLRGIDAASALARGDLLQAGIRLAPEAIADIGRASQLATDGVRTIAKGRQVMRPDETLPDGTTVGGAANVAKRALGFQPTGISRAREQMNAVRRAGEAPRDLFSDFNLRRANIQAALNRADEAVAAAKTPAAREAAQSAVRREAARMKRVMDEVEAYNAKAPFERQYKLLNPGYAQQLKTANQGQMDTQIKKVPMRVRGGIEDIRARF